MTRKKRISTKPSKKVSSVRHKDRRKYIPTQELRGFVAEEEERPQEATCPGLLYARGPSLDPQLVWKGKDQQDRKPLTVAAVPVYIQEKIQRQAIVEDIRAQARREIAVTFTANAVKCTAVGGGFRHVEASLTRQNPGFDPARQSPGLAAHAS